MNLEVRQGSAKCGRLRDGACLKFLKCFNPEYESKHDELRKMGGG